MRYYLRKGQLYEDIGYFSASHAVCGYALQKKAAPRELALPILRNID